MAFIGQHQKQRSLPECVDTDRIEAHFSKGLLTVSLPKKAEALKAEKVVQIKAD